MIATTLAEAEALDGADPLRRYRDRFVLPEGLVYLDGNSLGALPAAVPARISDVVTRQWGEQLIRGWNEEGWHDAPTRIGARIAAMIGTGADEVIACDMTSINAFKLVMAAAQLRDGAILAERDSFPTDAYVAAEAARLLGREVRMVDGAEIYDGLADDVAVAIVSHVNYRTGTRHDMARLNAAARAAGTRIVWDLSHSAGAVPLDLARDGTELAIGCGYKYLCGGPGAPAYLHVAVTLLPDLRSPIAGWWGHAEPFAFVPEYAPALGIRRFLSGTPPMISLLALEAGLDAVGDADPDAVWAKSCALWELFTTRLATLAPELRLITPANPTARGSQACFCHPDAFAIVQAAIAEGVIGDFRAPDIARFGFAPLYLGHADIWRAAGIIGAVVSDRTYADPAFRARGAVT